MIGDGIKRLINETLGDKLRKIHSIYLFKLVKWGEGAAKRTCHRVVIIRH